MLRADRNAAMLAGLLCAKREIKGLGVMEGLKGKKTGKVLVASDFDIFNNDHEPEAPKELSMEHMFAVLSGSKG